MFLDATIGGFLMEKSVEDVIVILEQMMLSDNQGQYNRSHA